MQKNFFNIVLHNPEIPQNAGNIARLCVSNDLKLHLIKPMGFELSDKYLKRAALDYWKHLNYEVHEDWSDFLSKCDLKNNSLWLLTTKTDKAYWDAPLKTGDYLVFGAETKGLPQELRERHSESCITIPMSSENSRSLNLASSVQTVYYEAYRQSN